MENKSSHLIKVFIRDFYSCLNKDYIKSSSFRWVALCSCDEVNTILKCFLAIRNWVSPAGSSRSLLKNRTSVFLLQTDRMSVLLTSCSILRSTDLTVQPWRQPPPTVFAKWWSVAVVLSVWWPWVRVCARSVLVRYSLSAQGWVCRTTCFWY